MESYWNTILLSVIFYEQRLYMFYLFAHKNLEEADRRACLMNHLYCTDLHGVHIYHLF